MAKQGTKEQDSGVVQDAPRKRAAPKPKERKVKDRGNGQGTVYEYKPGKWRWQVTVGYKPDGKRLSVTGRADTKTLAQSAMTQALADQARGLLAAPESITVSEYADKWLSRQKHLSANSLRAYRGELEYALCHIGKVRLRDVRPAHLKDLMVKISEQVMASGGQPMAPRTQGKVLTRLRSLFREAVSDQIIYVSPVEGVRKVKAPSSEAVGTVLDFGQAARFQEMGQALYGADLCRLWPALFTAVSVGLRRGEVMGLAWQQVDFEKGVLQIRQQLKVEHGKPVLGTLKTPHSRRDVYIPESLRVLLLGLRERQEAERAVLGSIWKDTGAVFATSDGGWTHPANLTRALAHMTEWSEPSAVERRSRAVRAVVSGDALAHLEAVARAGEKLPELSPHDLRHTYATLALRRKVPPEVVSKTLGHARVSITMDIYRHVLDSERRDHLIDLFEAPVPVRTAARSLPN
ncbi:tyrosine-type recombinase/integrase [Deinococcus sp.]|uniref:tyrosine-type recombinase/integrase n=1 Tax=Deinococcus sp. TaxID=47478 RepID=UPI003C7CE59E